MLKNNNKVITLTIAELKYLLYILQLQNTMAPGEIYANKTIYDKTNENIIKKIKSTLNNKINK